MPFELRRVPEQVFDRERLISEAHVHHGGGVTFGGGQVDQAALTEQVYLATVANGIFVHKRAGGALGAGNAFERSYVDFDVEVARVADHRAVFHLVEVFAG